MREIEIFVQRTFGGQAYRGIREDILNAGRDRLERGEIPESLGIEPIDELVYQHPDFTFYPERAQLEVDGSMTDLTVSERQLLLILCTRPNRAIPKPTLSLAVLGYDDGEKSLDHLVMSLRRKLIRKDGTQVNAIETVVKAGLKLVDSSRFDPEVLTEIPAEEEKVYVHDNYTHYPERHSVVVGGKEIHLNPTEDKLLSLLEDNRNHTLTFWGLYEAVGVDKNNLSVRMMGLRRKIEPKARRGKFQYIETVRSLGVRLNHPSKLPQRDNSGITPQDSA